MCLPPTPFNTSPPISFLQVAVKATAPGIVLGDIWMQMKIFAGQDNLCCMNGVPHLLQQV